LFVLIKLYIDLLWLNFGNLGSESLWPYFSHFAVANHLGSTFMHEIGADLEHQFYEFQDRNQPTGWLSQGSWWVIFRLGLGAAGDVQPHWNSTSASGYKASLSPTILVESPVCPP
jgi:membrane protein YqaA with SNARE-associated domain